MLCLFVCVFSREHHDIPLIVQTCVDEVEKRGLEEVGVYRVAGILRDVQELRQSFDTGQRSKRSKRSCLSIVWRDVDTYYS